MAAARTAVRGLSSEQLQTIRDTLAGGRRPKVMFTESAGQVAGQLGQVVALTDPAASDEWVVVRFGRDELPFSPADLSIPPRGAGRRPEQQPAPAAAPEPEFVIDKPPVPAAREEKESMVATTEDAGARPAVQGEPRPGRRAGGKAGRPKPPATLTVTLSYTDGEWLVGATQGSKALAKPYVIKPAEALKMVSLLDVPGVQEAVEQIVAAERAQAQAEADRLREQLAEIEARLAELREV